MCAYFDRFDIAEAYYVFASDWHGGPALPKVGHRFAHHFDIECQLSRMKFRARPNLEFATLSDNAKEIYYGLCQRFGYEFPECYGLPFQWEHEA